MQKNEQTLTFLVPDTKVIPNRFGFSESGAVIKRRNRYATRDCADSQPVDFVTHACVSKFRETSDGGMFPTKQVTTSKLGTAETGHGKIYLVSDYVEKLA
jgi:hypothetical protein